MEANLSASAPAIYLEVELKSEGCEMVFFFLKALVRRELEIEE